MKNLQTPLKSPPPPGTYLGKKPTKQELDEGKICTNCRFTGALEEFQSMGKWHFIFSELGLVVLGLVVMIFNVYIGYFILFFMIISTFAIMWGRTKTCPNCGARKTVKRNSKKGKDILAQPIIK